MSDQQFGYDPHIPEQIRNVFKELCWDMASLHQKWDFYLELFSDEETTALLSDVARASFNIIGESLEHAMTMAICRLSDPPQSQGSRNLSLPALVENFAVISSNDTLKMRLEEFQMACKPVRRHRNKRVGHRDLNTAIKPQANPLPKITPGQMNQILELASEILNSVYQHFAANAELGFQPLAVGGADALIHALRTAWETEQRRRMRYTSDTT